MPQHYLGIDIGTTAVKALVVDASGSVVGDAESPQELSVPQPGWAEQNPSDWWSGTIDAVRAACAQAGVSDITAIGPVGTNAQLCSPRRVGQRAEASDTLERRSHHGSVPIYHRQGRRCRLASDGGQSGA